MNRAYDGRLVKIILPDKTLVYVYKEKQSTELFETYMFNTIIFLPSFINKCNDSFYN